jgi:hypothetical protein
VPSAPGSRPSFGREPAAPRIMPPPLSDRLMLLSKMRERSWYITRMEDGDRSKLNPVDESTEAKAMEEFARMPSTLPAIDIDLRNFATEELATKVGEAVHAWLHLCGKFLNLKRLLRVIVAYNYNEALASIDRGAAVTRPLEATNDGIAVGIAMTPSVLYEGEARSVMVLNAACMGVLIQDETPELAEALQHVIYTLAHESAHVHDLAVQESCLPNTILRTQFGFRDGTLLAIGSECWDEYIACRLSAFMGKDATMRALEDTFCGALQQAKGRADAAIRQYRMHADLARVTQEVVQEYKKVMVYASYLLGHVDGMEWALDEVAPKAMSTIESQLYFKPFFFKLHAELQTMYSTYGNWKGLQVFEPLKQLAYDFLKLGGIDIQLRPDGTAYVDIPLTPGTTPTSEEKIAFVSARNAAGGK